jgi:hypothetical protein
MRLAGRRRFQRLHDEGLDLRICDGAGRADARFVIQALQAPLNKLTAPLGHGGLRRPQTTDHGVVGGVDAREDDARAKRHRTIHSGPLRQSDERRALVLGNHDFGSGATALRHAPVRSHFAGLS